MRKASCRMHRLGLRVVSTSVLTWNQRRQSVDLCCLSVYAGRVTGNKCRHEDM